MRNSARTLYLNLCSLPDRFKCKDLWAKLKTGATKIVPFMVEMTTSLFSRTLSTMLAVLKRANEYN